jgi:hypothetical protein
VLSGKEGDYRVEREAATYQVGKLQDVGADAPLDLVFEPQTFERKKDGTVLVDGNPFDRRARADAVALGTPVAPFENLGGSIADFARSWHFCSLYPNTLRALRPPTKDTQLAEDGSNWASVVRAMKKTRVGKEALEKISDAMRIAVAGYTDISVETAGSYLVPRISLRTRSDRTGASHKFDPVQLSDGTLRVFGILLALYQDPAPGLLVVEEPEQTIHPGALPVLADAFREASLRTQVVVTTHSPQFVDQFRPEEIRVAWMTDGQTRLSGIRASQMASVKGHLMSLGEFMLAEGLLPEPVDS